MWIRLDSAPYVGGVGGVLVQALTSSSYTDPAYNFAIGCGGAGFASNQNEWGAGWLDRYGTGGAATWHVTSVTGIDGGNGYTLSVGNWHHVVATYEKTGTYSGIIRLYVDGQLRALTPNFDNSANATPGATFLNTKALRTFINRNWAVDVDDPRKYIGDLSVNSYQIYQGLLSDAEILALYNAGYFITTATPINWLSSGYALLQSDATNFGRYVGSTIYGNSDANLTFTLAMMEYNYRSQWGT